ncbi:MAG: PEP-CTERM sorting domain-containing protein [Verrucomicrobiales bacterium]|jgi:hypothetical protein|nr:PEP-CTERM sorting domain-containing protein [Verrucomicrobiales bacterium]
MQTSIVKKLMGLTTVCTLSVSMTRAEAGYIGSLRLRRKRGLLKKYFTGGALGLLCAVHAASAQVLMFDFGQSNIWSANLNKSPYHAADTTFTGTTWNYIALNVSAVLADTVYSNLSFADNTAADSVTLSFGYALNSTTASFNSTGTIRSITAGNLFGDVNQAANDFILIGNDGNQNAVLGLRISGLDAGTYELYMIGSHASTANTSMNFWATTANADEIDIASDSFLTDPRTIASPTIPNTKMDANTYAEDTNYAKLTVTLAEDDVLTILSRGAGSDKRGFFNSLQIVTIPEPSTCVLLGLGLLTLALLRRKPRK